MNDLSRTIGNADDFNTFESKTIDIINKHAPKKTKVLRGNHKPHVSSEMRKAIMKRSQLKNIANNSNNSTDILKYRKQRNYVVKLNKKTKHEFFKGVVQ